MFTTTTPAPYIAKNRFPLRGVGDEGGRIVNTILINSTTIAGKEVPYSWLAAAGLALFMLPWGLIIDSRGFTKKRKWTGGSKSKGGFYYYD